MPFGVTKLEQLIGEGESSAVEFKLKVPPDHVLAANLSAFANAQGGTLILGVDEKGEIVGLTESDSLQAMTRLRRVASSLLPEPIEIDEVLISGKRIVYAAVDPVPGHLKPIITANGQFYVRRGSTSRLASESDLRSFVRGHEGVVGPRTVCRVFVAMSFREEEEPALVDYCAAIRRAIAATQLPLELVRIDLVDGDYEISQRIMDEIDGCQIIIADFTLTPANVYFELGYARGCKNKQIIQTARKATNLEFDVRNWRTEFYRNATELEEKLLPALRAAYARVTEQA
jgi:Schlafen, AlbA_2